MFIQVQTSNRSIEIQIVFHSNKSHAHNTQQNKFYYAHHATKYSFIRIRKDKEVGRNLTFQERAPNVSSLLLEQYNVTV